jgi:hypothetical protein
MAFLTTAEIKTRFPLWEKLLEDQTDPTAALEQAADDAEQYMLSFSTFDETLTAGQELHYMRIVKKFAFDLKHDGTSFKIDELPQIYKDFAETDKLLKSGLLGTDNVRMTAKTREYAPEE